MAFQVYQINRDLSIVKNANGNLVELVEAFQILASVAQNAAEGYGLTIQDVSLDGARRLRIRLSDPLPQVEVDSFRGDIIVV